MIKLVKIIRKYREKRIRTIGFLLLLISLPVLLWTHHKFQTSDSDRIVLTINKEPVSKAEVSHIISGLRTDVFSYFARKHGAEDGSDFWTTCFDGEVPLEILKRKTIDRLKAIKIQQILMKEYGLLTDISYSGFVRRLEIENARREKAWMNNIPIYGPIQFEEKAYYDYLLSERIEKLKALLSATEWGITEEEMKQFYLRHRRTEYRGPDRVEVEKIVCRERNTTKKLPSEKADASRVMCEIRRRVQNGEASKEVVDEFQGSNSRELLYEEHVLDGSNFRAQPSLYSELDAYIQHLGAGEVSQIFEGKNGLSIIRIARVKKGPYKPYSEVRGQVHRDLIDLKYEKMIRRLVETAVVEVVEEIVV